MFLSANDFDSAIYDLRRDRNETLIDFLTRCELAFHKMDQHGDLSAKMPDKIKGKIFWRKAHIASTLEDIILAKTNNDYSLSKLRPVIQQLARKPMRGPNAAFLDIDERSDASTDDDEYSDCVINATGPARIDPDVADLCEHYEIEDK